MHENTTKGKDENRARENSNLKGEIREREHQGERKLGRVGTRGGKRKIGRVKTSISKEKFRRARTPKARKLGRARTGEEKFGRDFLVVATNNPHRLLRDQLNEIL